jgi:hypothetical protein
MAPSSVTSDVSDNDVCSMQSLLLGICSLNSPQDGFIVDIDAIQAHGIGAVDISKLKANGYYTIAVCYWLRGEWKVGPLYADTGY